MSFHEDTADLARSLRVLITTPADLTTSDVSAFAAARTAVWNLVGDVHRSITDQVGNAAPTDLAATSARDLVTELNTRRLSALSAPPPPLSSPGAPDAATATGTLGEGRTVLGRAWNTAERSARLARATWETAPDRQRPSGAEILPLLADVTSLAWAMSRATTNAADYWARGVSPATRTAVLDHAAAATTSSATALDVIRHANGIHGINYADLRSAGTGDAVPDISEGLRRQVDLLHRSGQLPPAMAAHIAFQHYATTTRIGEALIRSSDDLDLPPLASVGRRLVDHARYLDVDFPGATRVTNINPIGETSWHVYRRARINYMSAADLTGATDKSSAAALLSAAEQVPAITTALADIVNRHVTTGAWLTRRPDPAANGPTPWAPTNLTTDLPLRTQLHTAARDATQLAAELPRRPTPEPPRATLGPMAHGKAGIATPGPQTWFPPRP